MGVSANKANILYAPGAMANNPTSKTFFVHTDARSAL